MDVTFDPPLAVEALQIAEGLTALWIGFMAVWLFWLGGSVGSFLNVVVYRLPLGKNLSKPRSSCPVCGHEIRARHNIPVLGWLILGGRCYDCRTPISSRYPLVEATLGTMFLLLGWELLVGGRNLSSFSGEMWGRMPGLPLGAAYALHAALITTLLGAALIEFDGRRIPASLFGPVLLTAGVVPIWFPRVRPLETPLPAGLNVPAAAGGAVDSVLGLLGGALLGGAIAVIWRTGNSRRAAATFAPVLTSVAVGLTLGWQGLLVTTLFAAVLFLAGVLFARLRPAAMFPYPAAAALYLTALIPTFRSGWFVGVAPETIGPLDYGLAAGGGLLILGVAARLAPESYLQRAPQSFPLQNVPAPEPCSAADPPADAAFEPPPSDTTHEL